MATIRKNIFWFSLGLTTYIAFTCLLDLQLSPVLLAETSWHTSVTALKIKRTNSPEPLNLGPFQSIHGDLFANALIQAKHLKCEATEKDLDTRNLSLSETVVIFNIALTNDTKDDLPTEKMPNKPPISKPFY